MSSTYAPDDPFRYDSLRAESVGGGGGAAEKFLAGEDGHETDLRMEEWDGEFFTSHVEYLSVEERGARGRRLETLATVCLVLCIFLHGI